MIDRYTKSVLTVIAVCLLLLVAENMLRPAHAQLNSGPQHVIVDSVAAYALQFAGPLAVHSQ